MPVFDVQIDNLQRFVDALADAWRRLHDFEAQLDEKKDELEAEAERAEPLLDGSRAAIEAAEAGLRASASTAAGQVNALIAEADAISGQQLLAAAGGLATLASAVEAGISRAAQELQADADALTSQGFAVFEQVTGEIEQAQDAARQALIDAMGAVAEAIEDQARQTEAAALEAVEGTGQAEQAVETETASFEAAAEQATAVWSDEMPPLILDVAEQGVRGVDELYHAWDETDLEGHQEFVATLDQVTEKSQERLDGDAEALQKAASDAEDGLVHLQQELSEAWATAEAGASGIDALGDSFLFKLERTIAVAQKIADLLEVL